ncbi:MAG: protein kinase [Planctomycetales bacterium]|nr:protein kinase [Planctomycetales bacterium]
MKSSIGPFDVLEKLGGGGMGVVYRARHRESGQVAAVKVLVQGAHASDEQRRRFEREAEAMRAFDHPSLVRLVESGRDGDDPYVAMEFVEGVGLDQWIAAEKPAPRRAVQMLRRIAEALAHAHGRGILHRDLKPSNVLVGKDDVPHVTDFGLARPVSLDDSSLTRAGEILGTPQYMSPEQARGDREALDPRSDLYSLGAILYRMLTGRSPFEGATATAVVYRVLVEPARSPRRLNPAVDRGLETICLKLLEKAPADRYPDARELVADLDRWLAGQPIAGRRPGRLARAARSLRARPGRAAATAGAAALVALVPAGIVCLGGPAAPAPDVPAARVRVIRVIDGDTIEVETADGRVAVQLLGVDAPEIRHPRKPKESFGEESFGYVRARVEGREVDVIGDLKTRDRYGRAVAHVHVDGTDLGATLIGAGYARVFARQEFSRRDAYLRLEREAREARRGLWGTAASPRAPDPGAVGHKGTRMLHTLDCPAIPSPENRIPFESRAAGEAAGYRAHRECLGERR